MLFLYAMIKLSVNINKIASLRNARGGNLPNVSLAAQRCELFGADGITVHPRPDERHITYRDVEELKPLVQTEFNVEGYPSKRFMEMVLATKPHQVTLVPDPPGVLTSNAGWDTVGDKGLLQDVIGVLKEAASVLLYLWIRTCAIWRELWLVVRIGWNCIPRAMLWDI